MTPEPDPEPEPEPDPDANTITITNSFNNSQMFVIKAFVSGSWSAITGGVATVSDPAVITFSLPENANQDFYRVYVKAYDNSHPNWNDSYYADANTCQIYTGDTQNETPNILVEDGRTVAAYYFNSLRLRITSQS